MFTHDCYSATDCPIWLVLTGINAKTHWQRLLGAKRQSDLEPQAGYSRKAAGSWLWLVELVKVKWQYVQNCSWFGVRWALLLVGFSEVMFPESLKQM